MARHRFAGDFAAWVLTLGASNVVSAAGTATITFWSARTGGSQYTDIAADAAGTGSPMTVTSSDGSSGWPFGSIADFYGPNDVIAMWASANGGPRMLILANDVAVNAAASLSAAGVWLAPQTFGPLSNANQARMEVYAEATGQVADLFTAYSGTDTGQGGARQRTTYLNEKGELRCITAKANSVGARFKGQSGQTAHLVEWTDISNNPLSWVEPDGRFGGTNAGYVFAIPITGTLAAGTVGRYRMYNDTGVAMTIRSVRANVGTAPTGAAITVDVNKNGTTIYTTQSGRPQIPAGAFTSGKNTSANVTALADGEYLTVDVDTVGSSVAGADLVVQVYVY